MAKKVKLNLAWVSIREGLAPESLDFIANEVVASHRHHSDDGLVIVEVDSMLFTLSKDVLQHLKLGKSVTGIFVTYGDGDTDADDTVAPRPPTDFFSCPWSIAPEQG